MDRIDKLTNHVVDPTAVGLVKVLKEGNSRFINDKPKEKMSAKQRSEMVKGQSPRVVILSCSDSRVSPEMLFDHDLGELFIIRVAGNVCNSDVLASAEYSIDVLKSKLFVILGHTKCGAVAAATGPATPPLGGHLPTLVSKILPIAEQENPVRANVFLQKRALERALGHKVQVLGAVYDLETGEVDFFDGSEN